MQSLLSVRVISNLCSVALAAGIAGCASVSVNKLDPSTGKVIEGAAEGLRYYLPRPYVSVFEPFIVSSDVYLANGQLSADGNYVLLTQIPKGLDTLVNASLQNNATQTMGKIAIDSSNVIARGAPNSNAGPQGAPVSGIPKDDKTGDAAKSVDGKIADAAKAVDGKNADAKKPEASSAAGGVINYKSTNDNGAYAVTPQPRFFNILWLPDFDEQYAVTVKPGLGNAGVTINLGQGWSLQGLDAKIDNSAIVKPLLDFWSGTLGALQKLANAKIEGPLALLGGGPQGAPVTGAQTAKTEFSGGTLVTVKITKVRIVAPGIYPILKPKEMASMFENDQKRILNPVQPFTNVAFNTYDAIVIEAARSTGDSALRIHQYVDSTAPGASAESPPTGEPNKQSNEFAPAVKKLDEELSKPENMTKSGTFYVATMTRNGANIKVQLRTQSGATGGKLDAPLDDTAAKKLVVGVLDPLKISVAPENISISK